MDRRNQRLGILSKLEEDLWAVTCIESFLIDRKAKRLAPGTIDFYRKKLVLFLEFAETREIKRVTEISPNDLRLYLIHLEDRGHNAGGIHACYRALRTFLYWFEDEMDLDWWKNPIRKVKPPKVKEEPLEPVEILTVKALVKVCKKGAFTGDRDRAILLSLLDTGCRATEFLSIDLDDLDLISGAILIRNGKGGKVRNVFLGKSSRKAVRAYLKHRSDDCPALWLTDENGRMAYSGLRSMIERRAALAGVDPPSLHSFRRAFAINSLRNGCDIYSLQHLMGHADLSILRRYLAQTEQDLKEAHNRASPVDNTLL